MSAPNAATQVATHTTPEAIDARFAFAKRRFSLAALACLRGAPDAAHQVSKALAELDAVRREMQLLAAPPDAEDTDAAATTGEEA
jgi:hypothetical protein